MFKKLWKSAKKRLKKLKPLKALAGIAGNIPGVGAVVNIGSKALGALGSIKDEAAKSKIAPPVPGGASGSLSSAPLSNLSIPDGAKKVAPIAAIALLAFKFLMRK